MTGEINIIDIINVMIRKWWIIAITTMVLGAGAYVYTDLFVEPMYKTDASLYVSAETETTQIFDVASAARLDSNYRLAATYVEILQRRDFLTEVSRDLNYKYSYAEIQNMITVSPVNETELLQIEVKGKTPEDVASIANSIINRAENQLVTVVRAGSVEIVDRPYVPVLPYAPNEVGNAFLGGLIGAVLAMGVIFLIEIFDSHIKSPDELKKRYKEPVLGEIPSLSVE